mgnify:CR=1 FL=1
MRIDMLLDDDCTEVLAGAKIQNKKKLRHKFCFIQAEKLPILHRPTLVKALRLQIGMS